MSNADTAVANPNQNSERGAMQLYHPFFNRAAAERVRSHGELQEYAELRRVALRWIASHPAQFARLTLQRIWIFWMPFGTSRPWMLWRCALYPLAVVGLALLCSGNHRAALLLGSMLVVYPLPYYFVQCYSRYGYPVEWAVTLAAGHAVAMFLRRQQLNDPSEASRFSSARAVL